MEQPEPEPEPEKTIDVEFQGQVVTVPLAQYEEAVAMLKGHAVD